MRRRPIPAAATVPAQPSHHAWLPGHAFERPLYVLALLLWILLALLVFAAHPVRADGIVIPVPPRDRPIPWRDIPLSIKYHRVDVTIENQVATTRVDQVFVNNANFAVEGTYIFPLPEDAAISSFDMWVDGKKLEGKLLNRDEARRIYEDIVRQQKDPALLEYVGRGAFQARIFPIPPGGERRIELAYSQVLKLANGLVHYRYPLNTEKFSARDIGEVAVTIHLSDKAPLRAIYSPSHAAELVRDGEHAATVSYEARNVRPDRDFDLYYSLSPDAIAVNLLSYKPYDEDGYFLLLVAPPVEAAASAVVAKDVVLVLDTSGSMDGEKIQQAKDAATYVLDHLGPDDRYNIVSFSTATRLFSDKPVPASRRGEGKDFVKRLNAAGSTDINRALLEALTGADAQRPTVVIFLTDGLPTAGETDPDRIVANVSGSAPKSVRLFAFGVGYDVDTVLLDQLSENQRGASSYVQPEQKIDEEVSGFYAKVSAPVLVDVDLKLASVRIEDVYPYPLPDLFAGSQLIVAGRYRQGGTSDLTLTGTVNGKPQTYTYRNLTFVERGGNEFIPRLWAQRKIGYLLTQIRLKGPSDELVKEVVDLSTRFGIVTPYTSFLVEEPGVSVTRDNFGRGGGPTTGGAAQPTAAPAEAPRSGAQAVEKAAAAQELRNSDQAAAPMMGGGPSAEDVIRYAGDKTFLLRDGVWVDTAFDAAKLKPEQIKFGSDRYFELLRQHPEIGPYLALGDKVTVVLQGKAYAITP
jgi:Ca-activated chloride channel homolog